MTRESDGDKESELQHALEQVKRLSFASKYEPLIELCTELIRRFPAEPTFYYERGQARMVLGLERPALDDMSRARARSAARPATSRVGQGRASRGHDLG